MKTEHLFQRYEATDKHKDRHTKASNLLHSYFESVSKIILAKMFKRKALQIEKPTCKDNPNETERYYAQIFTQRN